MKYISITTPVLEEAPDLKALKNEYKTARKVGRIALGTEHLFSKKWLTVKYVQYKEIYRVFRRVECVDMKMCCANGQIQLENIVLCNKKEELIQIDLPGLKAAEAVIEEIKKNNPDVKIGIKKGEI